MMEYTACLRGPNGIDVLGVSFAGKLTLVVTYPDKGSLLAVVHLTGGTFWVSQSQPKCYAPAHFKIWRLTPPAGHLTEDTQYRVQELVEFPAKRKQKKI